MSWPVWTGRIDLVLDAGPADVGIESTVLSLVSEPAMLLRPGQLSRAAIEAVIGPVIVRDATVPDAAPRASPGLMGRHYAPRARVVLVPRGDAAALSRVLASTAGAAALLHTIVPPPEADAVMLPDDPIGYARGLYAALHMLDGRATLIVVERVSDEDDVDRSA